MNIVSALRRIAALLLLFTCAVALGAAQQLAVPQLAGRVVDLSATLDAGQIAQLNAALSAFEQKKGSQIAVLIVPSTRPEAIGQYAIRVAEQWKIGRKKVDDGAIVVVAKDDREVRIEVGYGLEGALNDATSKRIIDDFIVPRFKQGDYAGGIDAGVNAMMQVIDGEPLPAARARGQDGDAPGIRQILPVALLAAVFLGSMLRSAIGRVPAAVVTGGIVGIAAWFLAGLAATAVFAGVLGALFTLAGAGRMAGMYLGHGHGHGGGYGGGYGGGGGFGGGGGSFGGGGASGRW